MVHSVHLEVAGLHDTNSMLKKSIEFLLGTRALMSLLDYVITSWVGSRFLPSTVAPLVVVGKWNGRNTILFCCFVFILGSTHL